MIKHYGKISTSLVAWASKIPHAYEIGEEDGSYWLYLEEGYMSAAMECGTYHEDTIKELKAMVKYSPPIPTPADKTY